MNVYCNSEPLDQPRGASAGYQPDHYEDDAHYGDDNSAADTSVSIIIIIMLKKMEKFNQKAK